MPKMLGQDYFLNVRSARILLRSTLVPNVAYVVFCGVENEALNVFLEMTQASTVANWILVT